MKFLLSGRLYSRRNVFNNWTQINCACYKFQCYSTNTDRPTVPIQIGNKTYQGNDWTNLSAKVQGQVGRNLHNQKDHPINIIKRRIGRYFETMYINPRGNPQFTLLDDLHPVVTTYQNFDSLLVPHEHVSRSHSDSYYINNELMLRAHTSAHQEDLIKMGFDKFLCVGDVYRRDTIDGTHYPVFHQMEGVCLFSLEELQDMDRTSKHVEGVDMGESMTSWQPLHSQAVAHALEKHLKTALIGMTRALFGKEFEYRWMDCYFPFTHPSWELEIYQAERDEWLEVLGCGIMQQQILQNAGADPKVGWAFGLGLDRLAMKLYGIPDIRYFWSDDKRFIKQFEGASLDQEIIFKPYSKHPAVKNTLSFWIPEEFHSHDFYDLLRNVCGDLLEEVTLEDDFRHPKTQRRSHMYRIMYRSPDRILTNAEIGELQDKIIEMATEKLGLELRRK